VEQLRLRSLLVNTDLNSESVDGPSVN